MNQSPDAPGGARKADLERWNLIIKAGTAVATIATVMVSIAVFLAQREEQIQQRELEITAIGRQSQQTFLDKQAKLYFETVSLVSKLANMSPDNYEQRDIARFWELYWGELGMVEDRTVETAMVYVGNSLGATLDKRDPECAARLKLASLVLAHTVRLSLEKNWGIAATGEGQGQAKINRIDEDFQTCGRSATGGGVPAGTSVCRPAPMMAAFAPILRLFSPLRNLRCRK